MKYKTKKHKDEYIHQDVKLEPTVLFYPSSKEPSMTSERRQEIVAICKEKGITRKRYKYLKKMERSK